MGKIRKKYLRIPEIIFRKICTRNFAIIKFYMEMQALENGMFWWGFAYFSHPAYS
jgi:hypothetical protein